MVVKYEIVTVGLFIHMADFCVIFFFLFLNSLKYQRRRQLCLLANHTVIATVIEVFLVKNRKPALWSSSAQNYISTMWLQVIVLIFLSSSTLKDVLPHAQNCTFVVCWTSRNWGASWVKDAQPWKAYCECSVGSCGHSIRAETLKIPD